MTDNEYPKWLKVLVQAVVWICMIVVAFFILYSIVSATFSIFAQEEYQPISFYDLHLSQSYQVPLPIYTTLATITGYSKAETCPDKDCITASGERADILLVACPKWIPLGTLIEIEEVGMRKCADRTADWVQVKNGDTFDLWFPSYEEAIEFGRKIKEVEIIK